MLRRNRKRKLETEDQAMIDCDQDNFFSDEMKEEMERMWEIPQIFHFFHLTRESLNIPQFSIYEMERMLLIPRASKQLANIMTCLLSSPITKAKVRKVPPMPYEFWTNILTHKITSWFKVYHAKHKDVTKVLETIGVEPEFWNIFPDASLLDGKDFEVLSFKQKVWLLKTVCDTIMHTRKTVQEDMTKQPWEDQFETTLGIDRYGTRYIYFPQFISNDLRIYRHSLDNTILSTVKPNRPKQETNSQKSHLIKTRLSRYRKQKSQFRNSLFTISNRYENSNEQDNNFNHYKYHNDSATSSFISEDTNLSNSNTYSDNEISLDAINMRRCRSFSKTSEESLLSNVKSSGYDTNTSNDKKSVNQLSQKMFKGFSNTTNDNCNIKIITELLDDLKSQIEKKRRTSKHNSNSKSCNSNSELVSQENSVRIYKKSASACIEILVVENDDLIDENERSLDNVFSFSKTDDEKLNEIISAESDKLLVNVSSKYISASDNVSNTLSTSKSDDEKLSETKSSTSNINMNDKESLNRKLNFNGLLSASSSDSTSFNEKIKTCKNFSEQKVKLSKPILDETKTKTERSVKKRAKLRSQFKKMHDNKESKKDKTEVTNMEVEQEEMKNYKIADKNKSLMINESELEEISIEDSDDYTNSSDIRYNLRSSKDIKVDECKEYFNEMLSDLNVSDFRLVVDSVEGLRDLIANFSTHDSDSNNISKVEVVPPCEVKLLNKLGELLNSLEKMETILKDATRKARTKLQREWSNFKEGIVEDQDSSSEGGLSSNWWVLGSQGCPFSTPGDATLQALPQPALSPFGSQNQQPHIESEHESSSKSSEQSRYENRESDERSNIEKTNIETRRRNENDEKKQKQHEQFEENEDASKDEDGKQQTRRVLRARGISSYTEQFYSDDESEEDELEEWTDVEAVYAAPSAQADTSAPHTGPKIRYANEWSETEDSDQDWILPSSRKRKNKRPSANRRLKSFHHKLQNIKENTFQNNVSPAASHLINANIGKDKLKDKKYIKESKMQTADLPQISGDVNGVASMNNRISKRDAKQTVPSTESICKIETVDSVHSELDIKDEGPIYDPTPNHYQNNYSTNQQQNFMMIKTDCNPMNYYVMQQNPAVTGVIPQSPLMQTGAIVPNITPSVHQGYYVQSAPNYIIQSPQANFIPTQQANFQQQISSISQPFINSSGYTPYMVTAPQPQTEYMTVTKSPTVTQQNVQDSIRYTPRPQIRYNQKQRYIIPRQNYSHLNGAVIRSNAPVSRSKCQRPIGSKYAKNNASQPRISNPKKAQKQKHTAQTLTESTCQKTTSLIVLSDSDDEIEMIITEKTPTAEKKNATAEKAGRSVSRKTVNPVKQKPTITSDITVAPASKGVIPPQIIQRMSQGGISITPVKNTAPSTSNTNTQLVVVVNETGSHYALALPNGSKLILTPDQVAQIRASNGGKLIL